MLLSFHSADDCIGTDSIRYKWSVWTTSMIYHLGLLRLPTTRLYGIVGLLVPRFEHLSCKTNRARNAYFINCFVLGIFPSQCHHDINIIVISIVDHIVSKTAKLCNWRCECHALCSLYLWNTCREHWHTMYQLHVCVHHSGGLCQRVALKGVNSREVLAVTLVIRYLLVGW